MNSSDLPEIITVSQLRDEIGDPTRSTQFASHVSDEMLQNIIDRHVDWLESQTFQRLQENQAKPVKQTSPVNLTCSANSDIPGVTAATLGEQYFPYATEGVIVSPSEYAGRSLDYQRNLPDRAQKAFHKLFAFDIENETVLVSPEDVQEITIFVPERKFAVREIMSDIISDVNANIIERALSMAQARQQEFAEPAYAGGGGSQNLLNDD